MVTEERQKVARKLEGARVDDEQLVHCVQKQLERGTLARPNGAAAAAVSLVPQAGRERKARAKKKTQGDGQICVVSFSRDILNPLLLDELGKAANRAIVRVKHELHEGGYDAHTIGPVVFHEHNRDIVDRHPVCHVSNSGQELVEQLEPPGRLQRREPAVATELLRLEARGLQSLVGRLDGAVA